jgi:hypothetical protein
MIIAIHQPNFFPWLGYFKKIQESNKFVFLDDVAYPKSSKSMGSYVNRVKFLIQKTPKWISCPVIREHGVQLIKHIRINHLKLWQKNILESIEHDYNKADHFEENWDWIKLLVYFETEFLCDYNINAIQKITDKIGLKTCFLKQSDMNTQKASTELLIEIIKKENGTSYLYGKGAQNYQNDEYFKENNILLIPSDFFLPEYSQQQSNYFPGLSILDAIFYCGVAHTRKLLSK